MAELSKLQIRAKVLSVISAIKSLNSFNEEELRKLYNELEVIEDRNALFDIFVKEYIKLSENECMFSACILKELVSSDYIQTKVFEILKSANYSDETKYKLVQLLRVAGGNFDYNTLPEFFDSPEEIIDSDTKKMLETAVFNPESMLDFLDFISAVPPKDRSLLLNSLAADYQGDVLANILYPVLYSDFEDEFKLKTIDVLSESKSSIAIPALNYIIKTSNSVELISRAKSALRKLKFSGANEEKADEYFKNIVKDSVPAEFYTTIPDGNGNQALLISRKNNSSGKFLLSAVVTNDTVGIIDCFGFFNISNNEINKVIDKFYKSEGKYKVTPQYTKSCIVDAINVNVRNKHTFPYEFICWNPLIADIEPLKSSYIDELPELNKSFKPQRDDLLYLLTKEYTFRWYIRPVENNKLSELTEKIYNNSLSKIDEINSLTKEYINLIFDEDVAAVWKKRIEHLVYLLFTNDKKDEAEMFYSLLTCKDLFIIFKQVIVQRSVFNYFVALKEQSKESLLTTNIFRRKQQMQEKKYDSKKLDLILITLKKNWINE